MYYYIIGFFSIRLKSLHKVVDFILLSGCADEQLYTGGAPQSGSAEQLVSWTPPPRFPLANSRKYRIFIVSPPYFL